MKNKICLLWLSISYSFCLFSSNIELKNKCKIFFDENSGDLRNILTENTIPCFSINKEYTTIRIGKKRAQGRFGTVYNGIIGKEEAVVIKQIALKKESPLNFNIRQEKSEGYDSDIINMPINKSDEILSTQESVENEFLSLIQFSSLNLGSLMVKPYAFFVAADSAYLVMEDGGHSLRDEMAKVGDDLAAIRLLAVKLLKAQLEFNKAGYVHMDLHPDNILISNDGKLKFIDLNFCVLEKTKSERPGKAFYRDPSYYRDYMSSASYDYFSIASIIYELFFKKPILLFLGDENEIGNNPIKEGNKNFLKFKDFFANEKQKLEDKKNIGSSEIYSTLLALHPIKEHRLEAELLLKVFLQSTRSTNN
jgi:serine/threonine protein kinase